MNPNQVQKIIDFSLNSKRTSIYITDIAKILETNSKKEIVYMKEYLIDKNLFEYYKYEGTTLIPTTFTLELIDKHGTWIEYLDHLESESIRKEERDQIEYEKSKVDLELAKETLKEFPRTKWFACIGFIIAIVLALKELYILLKPILIQ